MQRSEGPLGATDHTLKTATQTYILKVDETTQNWNYDRHITFIVEVASDFSSYIYFFSTTKRSFCDSAKYLLLVCRVYDENYQLGSSNLFLQGSPFGRWVDGIWFLIHLDLILSSVISEPWNVGQTM